MGRFSSFLRGRIAGIRYAVKGALMLIGTEHSIMVQFVIALCATAAGFYFDITKTEWLAQTLAIGLVLGIEGVNTAAEKIADFIHPDFHKKIGEIKDVAAGAVFFAAITGVAVAAIIYWPYLVTL